MTTLIKTKFKISDDQMNIDKYRLATNITKYHITSKLILQRIIITNFCCQVRHLALNVESVATRWLLPKSPYVHFKPLI